MKIDFSPAVALAAALLVTVCSSANAATISPSIFAAALDSNLDGTGDVISSPEIGDAGGGRLWRTFAEFNISGLTSPVVSATFSAAMPIFGQSLSLYGKVGDGLFNPGIDYALGTLIGPLTLTGSTYQANVTAFLNSLVATNPHHWAELQIVWSGPPTTIPVFGASIQLQQTPLPATLPLFAGGLGLIGLLARRRKQRQS